MLDEILLSNHKRTCGIKLGTSWLMWYYYDELFTDLTCKWVGQQQLVDLLYSHEFFFPTMW